MGRAFFFNRFPRTIKMLFWTMGAMLGITSLVAFVLAISLSAGPISLDFATSYIEDYLASNEYPHSVHVQQAELAWDDDASCLVVRAKDVNVQNRGLDHHSLKFPNFEFRYNLISLLELKFIPSSVTIVEPHLRLYQDGNGSIQLTKDQSSGELPYWQSIVLDGPLKNLPEVDIKTLNIDIENLKTGEKWSIPQIDLSLTRDGAKLNCDLSVVGLGAKAAGKATIDLVKKDGVVEAVNIGFSSTLSDFTFEDLDKFWHSYMAPPARSWVLENLSKADVSRANIEANWQLNLTQTRPTVSQKSMNGEIHFSGMEVRYFGDMPTVKDVHGIAYYNDKVFDIKVMGGKLNDMRVKGGLIHISGMDVKDQDIEIDVDVEGPMQTALGILDQQPLNLSQKLGMKLQNIKGDASGHLHFEFPLETYITIRDVDFHAKTALKNVSIKRPLGDASVHDIREGQFALEVDRKQLQVSGKAKFASIPTALSWTQKFEDNPQDWKVKYDIRAELTPADMTLLGYAGISDGPLFLKVQLLENNQSPSRISGEIDFSRSSINLPGIKDAHKPGNPGVLSFSARLHQGSLQQIDHFNVTGPNISLNPKVTLDPKNQKLKSVHCPDLKLGKTDLSMKLVADKHGKYHVDIKGKGLDLGTLLDYVKSRDGTDDKVAPFYFTCAVENAWFHEGGKSLSQLNASGYHNADTLETVDLSGKILTDKKVHVGDMKVTQSFENNQKTLVMSSDNAGQALDLLGFTPSVRQGSMELNMTKKANASWSGKLKLKDFHVVDAPLVTHILSLVSPFGIIHAVAGRPISFKKFSGHIVYSDDRILVKEGRAVGSSLGFNISGTINRHDDTVDLHGTILPYNAVNVFLAKVPVVSSLLGGKGGGIIGVNYGLQGSLDAPYSYVNPLSVLTPGILRNVFAHPEPEEDSTEQ
jgi:hypothetical protein